MDSQWVAPKLQRVYVDGLFVLISLPTFPSCYIWNQSTVEHVIRNCHRAAWCPVSKSIIVIKADVALFDVSSFKGCTQIFLRKTINSQQQILESTIENDSFFHIGNIKGAYMIDPQCYNEKSLELPAREFEFRVGFGTLKVYQNFFLDNPPALTKCLMLPNATGLEGGV